MLTPLQDSLSVPDPYRPAALALDTLQCHRVLLLANVFPAVVHCSGSAGCAASSHQAGFSPEELLSLAWASAVSRSDPGLKRGLCQFGLLCEPREHLQCKKGKGGWSGPVGSLGTRAAGYVFHHLQQCLHPASRAQTTTSPFQTHQGAHRAGAQKMSPSQRKTFPETASLKLLQILLAMSRHCFLHS